MTTVSERHRNGDVVRVRARDEILGSLDPFRMKDGCLFMEEMSGFCGKDFRVLKVVRNVFDESKYLMYATKSPLYLLVGSICSGRFDQAGIFCDRSCYFLWHEDWLTVPASQR